MTAASHTIAALEQEIVELREEVASLRQTLAWFRKQIFGSTSERRLMADPAEMGNLFGEAAAAGEEAEVEEVVRRKRRRKNRDGCVNEEGLRFDDTVPVKTIHVANPDADAIPEDERVKVGERVTHRLAQEPGSWVVLRYVSETFKRRDTGEVMAAPAPAAVLERSCADVSFLAGMIVDKLVWHLPLHRQHQRLQAAGITLSRASLTSWLLRTTALLEPIFEAQCRSVLESAVLAMDETSIKAGRSGPGKMRQAYFWPIFGDRNEIVFHYAPSREHRHVAAFLGDFSGTLLSDGYQGYEAYAKARGEAVVHASCWSHARREFVKIRDLDPVRCDEALDLIGGLYAEEEKIRNKKLAGREKLLWRREHSRPLVEAFWRWCDAMADDMTRPPQDPLLKAIGYARNHRSGLEVYLQDPDVEIDTNHLERCVRPIALGRRNWMFCWTEAGAGAVGILQSLVLTCRLHGIDPYTWLVDVLQRISVHPARDVAQLTPRLWKDRFAEGPMTSDVSRAVPAKVPQAA